MVETCVLCRSGGMRYMRERGLTLRDLNYSLFETKTKRPHLEEERVQFTKVPEFQLFRKSEEAHRCSNLGLSAKMTKSRDKNKRILHKERERPFQRSFWMWPSLKILNLRLSKNPLKIHAKMHIAKYTFKSHQARTKRTKRPVSHFFFIFVGRERPSLRNERGCIFK